MIDYLPNSLNLKIENNDTHSPWTRKEKKNPHTYYLLISPYKDILGCNLISLVPTGSLSVAESEVTHILTYIMTSTNGQVEIQSPGAEKHSTQCFSISYYYTYNVYSYSIIYI